MYSRVFQFSSASSLTSHCAAHLMKSLVDLQDVQDTVHLCLTGGTIANELYADFAALVPDSQLDPARLHLWWGDERFVPLTHPDRNSQQALAILARTLPISSTNTHLMPAVDGKADPTEAAFAYATDLGDVTFDICLLGVGPDGHVASIFPGHPGFEASGTVVGITNAPKPPPERISLTLSKLNQSRSLWVIASGESKADAIRRGLDGDTTLPIGHVHGTESTLWWLDDGSAGGPPEGDAVL